MFDEMFASEHVSYNHTFDIIEGLEDLGLRGRTHRKANHVLTFQVRVLSSGFTLPVAFYPVNGTCPSQTLAILVQDVVVALKQIGINVICSVSDQGPTNRGAIKIERSQCSEGAADPVYKVDGHLVVHLWDFPHLLKSIRNNLLTSNLIYEPGKIAKWPHIIEFFKLDEGICKLSRLTYAHLCRLGRNRMRVNLGRANLVSHEGNPSTLWRKVSKPLYGYS